MNKLFTKIYGWMFIGLMASFITGYYVSQNSNMVYNIFQTNLSWILAIIEIVVVIWLSARITKMSSMTAKTLYILYSILTGLTLSIFFYAFKLESIILVFGITSVMFAIMALIGTFTNIDLTKLGPILFMGLLGIIIASIINIFVGSESFDLVLTIIGIIIFTLYIAFDVQKVRNISESLEEDKAAIICAFTLYLDFINIFIDLMKLLGKNKD